MSHTLHLPQVFGNAPVTGQSPRMSPNALAFVVAWMERLGDRAAIMRVDERLVRAAQDHAEFLDSRTGLQLLQSMHIGRDGSLSNGRVMEAGYRLPKGYSSVKNNVESCARNAGGPQVALEGLLNSDAHRPHLLGIDGFSDRTVYGIGNCEADWVVVICPPEEAS